MARDFETLTEGGFTLIEVLTVLGVLGVLFSTAILNFQEYSQRTYNAALQSDFRNLEIAAKADLADPEAPRRYIIRNRIGPASLPAPLQAVRLSKDVRLYYAIKSFRPARRRRPPRTILRIQIGHQKGTKLYRYTYISRGRITNETTQEISL